ncbi:hypothetical protein JZ751_026093 [Albula glossodonta]|uniref:Immunoglobulin subtype domain-containing protein n=1 Tax=Albula glossodonta TaxID=121402 RepID=A0A8T2MP73_9TELE|nr:hypothetical protein JZ751_026093 [Albula glossodonta]
MALRPVALLLLCVGLSVQHRDFGAAVLRSVRAGASITLPCDLKNEIFTVWYRQSFDSSQQPNEFSSQILLTKPIPGVSLAFNRSISSISIKIEYFSDAFLGFYYCATKVAYIYQGKDGKIISEDRYKYSNVTFNLVYADASPSPSPSPSPAPAGYGQCCLLLVTVCPLTALLTTVLSAACGYSRGKQSGLRLAQMREIYKAQSKGQWGNGEDLHTQVKYAQL